MLEALASRSEKSTTDFGTWKTPWGDVNRFQRLTGDIVQPFNDAGPSIPVGFTSGRWGSLASFGARQHRGHKKLYGSSGNSFVAVVEFGDRVRAKAVSAGMGRGDPSSRHFNDQALRYSTGDLREVYFYKEHSRGTPSAKVPARRTIAEARPVALAYGRVAYTFQPTVAGGATPEARRAAAGWRRQRAARRFAEKQAARRWWRRSTP